MFTKTEIEKYFFAEKGESLLFMIVGSLAIIIALFFIFYWKTSFAKGLALPLVIFGLIQFVVGWNVYKKSDSQRIDVVYAYDMDPNKLRSEELPRMKAVMKNFVVLRYIEIALFIAGLALFFVMKNKEMVGFWFGFGISLSIQALLTLILDFFAEKRGHTYLEGLITFLK